MEIAKRFKNLRKSMGLNQTEFGEIFGLKYQTISDIERSIKEPSKTAVKFAIFRFGKKFGIDRRRTPPERSPANPGSLNDRGSIDICGYKFRNKKTALKYIEYMWNIEQLNDDLFNHELICLKSAVDAANIVVKKVKKLTLVK